MSEQGTTKDRVSLHDLRHAIERIPPMPMPHKVINTVTDLRYAHSMAGWNNLRAEAWRTAFTWLHNGDGLYRCGDNYAEGIRLIQEKLR